MFICVCFAFKTRKQSKANNASWNEPCFLLTGRFPTRSYGSVSVALTLDRVCASPPAQGLLMNVYHPLESLLLPNSSPCPQVRRGAKQENIKKGKILHNQNIVTTHPLIFVCLLQISFFVELEYPHTSPSAGSSWDPCRWLQTVTCQCDCWVSWSFPAGNEWRVCARVLGELQLESSVLGLYCSSSCVSYL